MHFGVTQNYDRNRSHFFPSQLEKANQRKNKETTQTRGNTRVSESGESRKREKYNTFVQNMQKLETKTIAESLFLNE